MDLGGTSAPGASLVGGGLADGLLYVIGAAAVTSAIVAAVVWNCRLARQVDRGPAMRNGVDTLTWRGAPIGLGTGPVFHSPSLSGPPLGPTVDILSEHDSDAASSPPYRQAPLPKAIRNAQARYVAREEFGRGATFVGMTEPELN